MRTGTDPVINITAECVLPISFKKSSFLKTQKSKKATLPHISSHLQLHRLGASTMEAWVI
jgi:hypothetical protein